MTSTPNAKPTIAFYGSSLLSSYWNGAATYYRGLIRALDGRGYRVTFFEPDVYDRQKNRDIDPPDWCDVVVYDGTIEAMRSAVAEAGRFDVVVKASGVGFEDDALLDALLHAASPEAVTIFWDVDAPATLAEVRSVPDHPLRRALQRLDLVMTYGGGDPVVSAYQAIGARRCVPIYNALDPTTHHPVDPDPRFAADLAFLGNRLPDRESRVETFFLEPAKTLWSRKFLLGGAGWGDRSLPPNVAWLGHVATRDHNALNVSPKAVLNINRESMAAVGFSPPTRVFEAAGAGACLMTDHWTGIELFLKPDEEVLVVRDAKDVADALEALDLPRSREIGRRALQRVLAEHTYDRRAERVDRILVEAVRAKRAEVAA